MKKTKKIALLGLMLALMAVLTAAEHMLPPLPGLPPGVRLGLSNIVVMYCVFFAGRIPAVTLNILKAFFVFATRGFYAGLFSLCGGLLSVLVVILLAALFRGRISYAAVSVSGAVAHNIGQYAAVWAILRSPYLIAYLPLLILSGIVTGIVTGALLKAALPALKKVGNF